MRNRLRCRKGNAILEFALAAGILVPAFAGTFQFGYTFYTYNQLVTAVGNGARYAAQRTYRTGSQDVERGNEAIRDYMLALAEGSRPRVCLLPTASGDSAESIVAWYDVLNQLDCRPRHLRLFQPYTNV